MQSPQLCAEIFGDIASSEGSIQAKLGVACAQEAGDAAANLFDALGKIGAAAQIAGGGGFILRSADAELMALNQSLAKEAQIAELAAGDGIPIAGAGTNTALRQAGRLAEDYGGNASDWQKVTSSSYTGADGTVMETHAYQNVTTGWVVEPKTIFP